MKQQPPDVVIESERSRLFRLFPSRFGRNENIAKIAVFSRKRQYIRRLVQFAIPVIILPHRFIRYEHDTERFGFAYIFAHILREQGQKLADAPSVEAMFPLAIQQIKTLTCFHLVRSSQTSAFAVAVSAQNRFRTPGQFVGPADAAPRRVR